MDSVVELLTKKMLDWYAAVITMLPNVIVASLVVGLGYLLSLYSKPYIEKLFEKLTTNTAVVKILASSLQLVMNLVTGFTALGILGLEKTVTSLLAGAGVIGLVIGFAFQEISANFISGILIAFQKPFVINDVIKTSSYMGRVSIINLRSTVIRTYEGQDIYVPNKQLMTEPLINYTADPRRLISLAVGVAYDTDLQKTEDIIYEALKTMDTCDYKNETKVYFTDFGDSSINIMVHMWIRFPSHDRYFASSHEAIKKIKEAFDANNISIPFPIRTLDINDSMVQKIKGVSC